MKYPTCPKCEGRLYQIYYGGRKDMWVDHYFCKACEQDMVVKVKIAIS